MFRFEESKHTLNLVELYNIIVMAYGSCKGADFQPQLNEYYDIIKGHFNKDLLSTEFENKLKSIEELRNELYKTEEFKNLNQFERAIKLKEIARKRGLN